MVGEVTPYLRCSYVKGLFADECAIDFSSGEEYLNSCFVKESDMIKLDFSSGLVKLIGIESYERLEIGKDNRLVKLYDSCEGQTRKFVVPEKEIVFVY